MGLLKRKPPQDHSLKMRSHLEQFNRTASRVSAPNGVRLLPDQFAGLLRLLDDSLSIHMLLRACT